MIVCLLLTNYTVPMFPNSMLISFSKLMFEFSPLSARDCTDLKRVVSSAYMIKLNLSLALGQVIYIDYKGGALKKVRASPLIPYCFNLFKRIL